MQRIGFIGLGIMGGAMAHNVHRAGFQVAVFNRTPQRVQAFRERGIPVHSTPRSLAEACDAVVVMVTGPEALASVVGDPEGGLTAGSLAGKVVINSSTVSPEATLQSAEWIAAAGGEFLDAPVSGSRIPAETATLVFLTGGDGQVLERCRPLLQAMGKAIIPCGGIGQGTRMKLAINLLLAGMVQALAESLILSRGMGLDPALLLQALGAGPLAAPILTLKGEAMTGRAFDKHFPLSLLFKDLNLILEEGGRRGIPLPATAALRECYNAAMARGLGDEDMAAVIKVLELLAGLEPPAADQGVEQTQRGS